MITFDFTQEDDKTIDFGGVGENYREGTQRATKFSKGISLPDGTKIRCVKWYYVDDKNFNGDELNELTEKECNLDFEKQLPRNLLYIMQTCIDVLTHKK